jgi:hypothetical protein
MRKHCKNPNRTVARSLATVSCDVREQADTAHWRPTHAFGARQ